MSKNIRKQTRRESTNRQLITIQKNKIDCRLLLHLKRRTPLVEPLVDAFQQERLTDTFPAFFKSGKDNDLKRAGIIL